ncbi:poly [ADP-ribose] polymerase 2-A [Iris pallida]|uniref:Poly [ADP-ribose] polymerase n=1 Tax=Iris pallida TaxID=29817 RepID=A0AAX6I5Q8_IRIPA|nr:poly [ADP-ribose] polymerase 2-A [Iris pallida]
MASRLRVDELRSQLSLRGLDAAGTKPVLVRRLESAIEAEEEEKKKTPPEAASEGAKKRPREEEDGGGGGVSMEKLVELGVRQLRDLAKRSGLPASGSRKELVQRLCAAAGGELDSEDKIDGGEDTKECRKEKLVKATKKGGAVLDPWLPEHIKSGFHVLEWEGEIYDATLNQTNVGDNNNKFFLMQILESDDGGKFMVYYRWGRVGVRGQDKLHGPYASRNEAIGEMSRKFFDKTRNYWSDRKSFTSYPKYYTWVEMDYGEAEKVPEKNASIGTQLRETKLEPRIAKFISLVCNISMMKQQMIEIGYNAEKLPLGKLSKSTISKGYDVLRRLSDVISQSDRKVLEQLSGEFYTIIPHDFGFKKMREFIIDTPYKLKCKLEMVAALDEIEIATKILKDDAEQEDPMYSRYERLQCELKPVEVDSEEYSVIEKYVANTHAKTHSSYTVDIAQVFKISRNGEPDRFSKFTNVKNRMLLWHGSRLTNWTGILSQGLRIAPPEAPVTGYMFGKGVYFADMFSKSANYCFATKDCSSGVLLLCEVALGDMAEKLDADYNADRLPTGKLSTKGVGATAPDMSESHTLEDGVVIPLGKPKKQAGNKGSLQYNEYIVYNVDQIRMRYIVQVNFNFKRT